MRIEYIYTQFSSASELNDLMLEAEVELPNSKVGLI